MTSAPRPWITAIISTYNRAGLLRRTLESLVRQTLAVGDFEVVIVDDGSSDDTRAVCETFAATLPHRYAYQRNAGLASARNHGLYLSSAPLVLFLDDDDVTDPRLLEQHVLTHRQHPADNRAVLGYTPLDPALANDPLMHFVTEVGCFLFSYPSLRDGDVLDFEHFWGGRSSCKRAFLLEHGVFNPIFKFGCEDIELSYRLSKHDFRVVYNAQAITTMVRGVNFDEFCARLIRQGRSNFVFSRLHPDPVVQRWTRVADFEGAWGAVAHIYREIMDSTRHLHRLAILKRTAGFELEEAETALLHRGYWNAFRAAILKGILEAKLESEGKHVRTDSTDGRDNREEMDLRQEITARDETIRLLRRQFTRLQQVIDEQHETLQSVRAESARQQQLVEEQRVALEHARGRIADMGHTISWRLVSFLREVKRRLGVGGGAQ